MKKDKEWLKEELVKLKKETDERNKYGSNYTDEQLVVRRMRDLADQLEEPQQDIDTVHDLLAKITTLSQEDFDLYWNCINDGVAVSELKQEELVIPQFVADWIEKNRDKTTLLDTKAMMIQRFVNDDLTVLDWVDANDDLFARAWLDGYKVEPEPKTYRFTLNAYHEIYVTAASFEEAQKEADKTWNQHFVRQRDFGGAEYEGEVEEVTE